MKKRNKFIAFISIFLVIISLIVLVPRVGADSGWDGDYDSGGSSWGGGSSDWGGGSSWGSSSGGSSSGTEASLGFIIFLIVIGAVVYAVIMSRKKGGSSGRTININYNSQAYPVEKIKEVLPTFDLEQFKGQAYQIYKDIQEAWMEFDYDTLRKFTTDELFNMYKTQLTSLSVKKQKNIMLDFELHNFTVTGMEVTEDTVSLKTTMLVSCYDYVVDKDNKVVRGTDQVKVNYYYEMTFIKGISKETNKCPNCNAPLENTNSNKCPYCGSVVISDNHDWVLSKKQMIKQTRG